MEARVAGLGGAAVGDTASANAYLLALGGDVQALVSALGTLEAGGLFGGGGAKPDRASYEIVMDALLKAGGGMEEAAAALFPKMQPPTAKGVTLAMTALLRAGKPQEALGLLPAAVASGGVEPTEGMVRGAMKAAMALGGGSKALDAVKGQLVL